VLKVKRNVRGKQIKKVKNVRGKSCRLVKIFSNKTTKMMSLRLGTISAFIAWANFALKNLCKNFF